MNKGTAIVGFLLCFLTGMGLMYGIERSKGGVAMSAEPGGAAADHAGSPLPVSKNDPSWGNPDALVTIVEFSDFQCPFCTRVEETMKQVKQSYSPDKVRVVWKNNPLPFHNKAKPAAEAAQAVFALGGSNAFWKFHATLFENQKAIDEASFEKWATEAGVDGAKVAEAVKSKTYAAKVEQDMALAKKVGASGTPAFRINGKTLSGAQPLAKFKEIIDAELKAAEELLKSGTKKGDVSLALTKKNFQAGPDSADGDKKDAPPAADDKTVWKVEVAADDPVRGAKDALVTLVLFSDFQCPFCTRVEPTVNKLLETYKNELRVVWKDNPLPFHDRAKQAAALGRVAYAKGGNDLFWKAHEELFKSQKDLSDAGLEAVAKKIGLDWATVKAAIDTNKYNDKISATLAQGDELEAKGTPHFFINGRRLAGAQPFEKFKAIVDEEVAKGQALVKKGIPAAAVYAEIMKTAKGASEPEKRNVPEPTKDNAFKGPAKAPIVIQEFSDFQCPFCTRVNPTIKQVMDEYAGKVKVVWRNMPLPFHKEAPLAAEAAQEAFVQKGNDGFWAMHDKLFANQKALTRPDLEKYAEELGLDMAKFKAALDSNRHKAVVEADMQAAKQAGVSGTPAFTINGYFISGAQPYEKFDKIIKYALKNPK